MNLHGMTSEAADFIHPRGVRGRVCMKYVFPLCRSIYTVYWMLFLSASYCARHEYVRAAPSFFMWLLSPTILTCVCRYKIKPWILRGRFLRRAPLRVRLRLGVYRSRTFFLSSAFKKSMTFYPWVAHIRPASIEFCEVMDLIRVAVGTGVTYNMYWGG